MTINPLACPLWSAEHESNLAKTYDSYTTRRDAIQTITPSQGDQQREIELGPPRARRTVGGDRMPML